MKTFKQDVERVAAELKAHPRIKVEKGKAARPMPSYVENTFAALKLDIPDALYEIYREANGAHIAWRAKDKSAAGELFLQPIATTFTVTWKNKLWFDWMEGEGDGPAQADFYRLSKALKGFDVADKTLDGSVIIALSIPEGGSHRVEDFRVYYWDAKGLKFPMSLSATDYVERALMYRGMLGWQRFFVDLDAMPRDEPMWQQHFYGIAHTLSAHLEAFIPAYEALFGEEHVPGFRERADRIEAGVRAT